jgi:hypothetical protein
MLAKRHNFLKLRDLYYEIRYGIFHTYWISLKESTELMNNTEIGKIFKSIVKKLSDLGEVQTSVKLTTFCRFKLTMCC